MVRPDRGEPFLVYALISITVNEMARAFYAHGRRNLAGGLSLELVKRFKERTLQVFMGFVRDVATEYDENILD